MNDNTSKSPDGEGHSLPSELDPIVGLLDRMVAMERAGTDDELEHRVFGASLEGFRQVEQTHRLVASAASLDTAAADLALEARVHDASVPHLHAPAIRLAQDQAAGAPRTHIRRSWASTWRARSALAALVAGAVTLGVWKSGLGPVGKPPANLASIETLRTHVDNDFDLILAALGDTPTTDSRAADTEFKAEWIDDMLDEGASS